MKPLSDQFFDLCNAFPAATMTAADGGHLIRIVGVKLPDGWSQSETEIRFVVPNGYPYAAPDCFWADHGLRLANGAIPLNAQLGTLMPGQNDPNTLWFSWHVNNAWKPGFCDLLTYVKIIRNRFEERK
jgi:Prokaryotic E2 family E